MKDKMKNAKEIMKKHLTGRRGTLTAVSIVLVLAMIVSMFTGIIPVRLTASAATGSGSLTSLNGKNTIPGTYTAVNVPAGTRKMTADEYLHADIPGKSADGIAAFDFLIFANRFSATVHTCGNIAVNELGYEVLGNTGSPEFGSRAGHDLDVERVSYVGDFKSWCPSATADYFVFGPNVKISGRENGQVKYGNNNEMMGNDTNGNMLGHMYIEDSKGSFLNIGNELREAEDYMRYLVWLMNKAKEESDRCAEVLFDNSEWTNVLYLDSKAFSKNNGKVSIDFSSYNDVDTIAVELTAAQAQNLLKGNIALNGTAGKRIIFNIDMSNFSGSEFKLNDTYMTLEGLDNCEETANYDNNILWNFYKMENDAPESYTGVINVNGTWMGTINAPEAIVRCYAGVNGSIIANQVTSRNETHKADYTGERVRTTSLSVPVHKIWDDDPSVRPDYITLRLKRNGELYKTVQVTADDCTGDDYNWYYSFTGLPATDANGKTYQYKVEEAPIPGYETSQMNNTIINSSDYTPVYYDLTVNKVDNGGAPLPGAVFELTASGVNLSGARPSGSYSDFSATAGKVTWKSSGKGSITISHLLKGSYTVTEITAPAGYQKADAVNVDLTGNKIITVRNTPLAIQVEKLNGSENNAFLPGSTFTLEPVGIDFNYNSTGVKVDGAASYDKSRGSIEWVSGHGTVTISGIPAGTYTVTETKSPDGFDIAPPVTLVLSDDGTVKVGGSTISGAVKVTDYLLPEDEELYSLRINKKDEAGNLAGAQLELISVAGKKLDSKYDVEVTGAASSEVSDSGKVSFTTGSGAVSITGLPGGSYILHEVSAPEGYCLANDIAVTLNEGTVDSSGFATVDMLDNMLSVSFIKANSITGSDIAGAKFKVEEKIGSNYTTIIDEAVSPGNVCTLPLPHAGTYVITELEAPEGYFTAAPIRFTVDGYGNITNSNAPKWDSGTVTMYDQPCELKLFKSYWNDKNKDDEIDTTGSDKETGMLSGAELILTAKNDGVDLKGVTGSIPVEPADVRGSRITAIKWISGSEANTLYALPDGSYTLTEGKAPDGYQEAPGISFDYSSDGSSTSITNIRSLVSGNKPENAPIIGSDGFSIGIYDKKVVKHEILIQKIKDGDAVLPGAFFAVYPKDSETENGEFDPDKTLAYFESGDDPQKLILPDGDYYLVEVTAPEGYKKLNDPIEFTVSGDDLIADDIPQPTAPQPEKVGEVSATLMPQSVLASTVTLSGAGSAFTKDGAEYLVIDLSEVNSAIESVTVHKTSGSGSPAAAAVSGITCGSFTPDASDPDTLTAALTDSTSSTTGKYLVIAEVKDGNAVSDITFDSVSVAFANGGSAEIADDNWGYYPDSTGGGVGDGINIIGTYVCDKNSCEVSCYPSDKYDDYLAFMQDKGFATLLANDAGARGNLLNSENNYLVINITDFAKDLSQPETLLKVKIALNEKVQNTYGYIAIFSTGVNNLSFINSIMHNYGDAENEVSTNYSIPFQNPNNSECYIVFTPTADWGSSSSYSGVGNPIDLKFMTFNFATANATFTINNIAGENPGGENPKSPKEPTTVDVMTHPAAPQGGGVEPGTNGEPPVLKVLNEIIPDDQRYVYGFNISKVDDSTPAQVIRDGSASFAVFSSRDDSRLSFRETDDGEYEFVPAGGSGTVDTLETYNGALAVTDLEQGSYYFYEIEAPDGYILCGDRKDVTLPEENGTTYSIVNTEIKGELLITKLDDKGGTRSGAVFGLYTDNYKPVNVTQGETVGYYVYDASTTGSNTIVTGDSGHITVTGLPVNQKYYVQETQAPAGCAIDVTTLQPAEGIELTSDAPGSAYTVTDTAYQAGFAKADSETGDLLKGAVLALTPDEMSDDYTHPVFAGVTGSLETEHYIEYTLKENTNEITGIADEKLIWTTSDTVENILYGLPAGSYTLTEVSAPAGYGIASPVSVTVGSDGTVNGGSLVTMYDDAMTGSVTLTKYDSFNGAPLDGAKFILKGGDEYVVRDAATGEITFVTDKSAATEFTTADGGVISVIDLPFGKTYTFEEIAAPTGYAVSAVGVSAEVKADDLNKEVSAYDARVPAKITLTKTDTTGAPVDGAGFVFCRIENGTPLYVKVSSGVVTFTESITEATEYTTVNGEITIEDLFPWGYQYSAVEVTVPEGYLTPENNTTPLSCSGIINYSANVTNSKGGLTISKQDSSSHPLAGASLSLTKNDGGKLSGVSVKIGTNDAGTLSSDKTALTWLSGTLPASIENIPAGTYTLTETAAPTGYAVSAPIVFTVGTDGKVTIDSQIQANETVIMTDDVTEVFVSKKAAGADSELPGASLRITAADTTTDLSKADVPAGVTAAADQITWISGSSEIRIGKLPAGNYTLTEVSAPKGYAVAPAKTFTIEADGTVKVGGQKVDDKTVLMRDNPTEVTVSKIAVGGTTELKGASLKITAADTTVDLSKTVVPAGVTAAAGEITWTSGDDAVTIGMLPAGTYTITETAAPANYDIAPAKTFVIEPDGTVKVGGTAVDGGKVVIEDALIKYVTVNISKVEVGGGDELPGASLVVKDSSNAVIDSWTSGTTKHTIEKQLPAGTYTLTEITAPNGYEKAETITFVIDKDGKITVDGEEVTANTVVMEDAPSTYTVHISKVEVGGGDELPGASLVVKDSSNAVIDSWTSGTTKHTISKQLPAGTYTLTEITAPNGYEKAETITFVIDKDGKITVGGTEVTANTVVMEDAPSGCDVYISKVEVGGGDELPGAQLTVKDSSGTVIDEWESTEEKHLIKALPAGTYTLTEITAPKGYKVAETMTFTIDNAGVVRVGNKVVTANTVVMEDAPNELVISKQAVGGGDELKGAVLKIVPLDKKTDLSDVDVPDGVKVEKNLISWTSGDEALTIGRIPDGIYTFTEITAPSGYDVAETIYIKVSKDGVQCVKASEYKENNTKWNTVKDDTVIMYDSAKTLPPDNGTKNGSFSFIKNSNLGKAVKDAEFTLVKGTSTKTATSAADGKVVFADIAPGTYTLTESKAPTGYSKASGSVLVTVSSAGIVSYKDSTGKVLTVADIEKLFVNKLTPVTDSKTITENKPVNLYDELVKENEAIKDVPLQWSSSDPSVASVDNNGNVTFKKPGKVTITAKNDSDVVGTFILGVADSAIGTINTYSTQGAGITNVTVPAATPTTVAVIQTPSTNDIDNPDTGDRINLIAFLVSLTIVAGVTAKVVCDKRGRKDEETAE